MRVWPSDWTPSWNRRTKSNPDSKSAAILLAPYQSPTVSILLALGIVTPMGPLIWRFAFRPVSGASVLTLLILAMALHFVLIGLGLVFFGPEEASAPALTEAHRDGKHS